MQHATGRIVRRCTRRACQARWQAWLSTTSSWEAGRVPSDCQLKPKFTPELPAAPARESLLPVQSSQQVSCLAAVPSLAQHATATTLVCCALLLEGTRGFTGQLEPLNYRWNHSNHRLCYTAFQRAYLLHGFLPCVSQPTDSTAATSQQPLPGCCPGWSTTPGCPGYHHST